jgi:hypothetical protein
MRTLVVVMLLSSLALAQVMTDKPAAGAITVTVLDAKGEPAPGLTIAGLWGAGGYMGEGDRERMVPVGPTFTTGKDGKAKVTIGARRGPYVSASRVTALLTYDRKQENAAIAILVGRPESGKVTLRLGPVATVRGRFSCKEPTPDAAFEFKLPRGRYAQHCFGEEVALLRRSLHLEGEQAVHDLGTVDLDASGLAKSYGKEPPYWWIREARGVDEDVVVADYKGRWLLVIYWAWW